MDNLISLYVRCVDRLCLLAEEVETTLAVFLASDGAVAINGQLLNVCGGTVMY